MKRLFALLALLLIVWLFWLGKPLRHSGTLDADPFSLFLGALVFAGVSVPRASSGLFATAGLLVLAVSTRNVIVFSLAFSAAGVAVTRYAWCAAVAAVLSLPVLSGTDLAALADSSPSGLILVEAGAVATWFAVLQATVWRAEHDLAEGVFFSFGSLVALASFMIRVTAWNPELASVYNFHSALAVASLAAGAWGVWRAKSSREFVGWLAISQLGYLSLFVLGAPRGREAVLLQLVTSGFALFAAALARDRFLLALGAFATFSPPPFPGFAFKLFAASSVLGAGHVLSLSLALVATIVLGLGCQRFVMRAELAPVSRYSVTLGSAAILLLGVAPELSIRAVSRALAGLF